jgi:hypothetical protein
LRHPVSDGCCFSDIERIAETAAGVTRRGFDQARRLDGHASMTAAPMTGKIGWLPAGLRRMKGTLARLGICNFKPTLRKAAERLSTVHTPEGMPLPPNTFAEQQVVLGPLRSCLPWPYDIPDDNNLDGLKSCCDLAWG